MKLNITKLDDGRKQAIINSALKEFVKRGYDRASTNEIAKNAQISKALMFHYTNSKEALFLYLMDYCQEKINIGYINKMDFEEKDLLVRLHHSYLLQIEIIQKNPWILDFTKLTMETSSKQINEKLKEKENQEDIFCFEKMFVSIDETKFRKNIEVSKAKELIYLGNIGLIGLIIKEIQSGDHNNINYDGIINKIDNYFDDLTSVFYDN
ncbi:hypothetical protein A5881_003048 [Enterococcus termitis]|nr:hypothetical protein A5881_002304 [Enterococcus termitis]